MSLNDELEYVRLNKRFPSQVAFGLGVFHKTEIWLGYRDWWTPTSIQNNISVFSEEQERKTAFLSCVSLIYPRCSAGWKMIKYFANQNVGKDKIEALSLLTLLTRQVLCQNYQSAGMNNLELVLILVKVSLSRPMAKSWNFDVWMFWVWLLPPPCFNWLTLGSFLVSFKNNPGLERRCRALAAPAPHWVSAPSTQMVAHNQL